MAQEIVTLECTEAKALGKPASRYMTTRNKKSPRTPNRLEKKKYNPFLQKSRSSEKIRHGERQNPSPPRHWNAGASASQNHTRDQAQPLSAVNEIVLSGAVHCGGVLCGIDLVCNGPRPTNETNETYGLTLVEFFRLARSASKIRGFRLAGRLRTQAVCFGKGNRETCFCVRHDGP